MATETAPAEQAARERKVDAFVFDCVCHIFNFDPANAIGPPGQLFDEHLYAFHQLLTKEGEKVLSREQFMKEWSVDEIYEMVIEGSGTDMIVAQPLPLTDLFHDGLSPWEKCAEMAAKHPDRAVFWGSVNPLEGKKALDLMTRQVEDHGARAFKFYNVRYDYGQPFPWRMDDPRIAYPVFERAQELGVNLIGVHKGVPLGPQPIEHTRTFDMDGAAANFPDINFVIFHVGLPWLDEVLWQIVRYPNLYASIAATVNFISRQPRVFAETLGKMMWWCGEDKIIYGGESPIWHPQWALEAFWNFELPRDIVEERGYPQRRSIAPIPACRGRGKRSPDNRMDGSRKNTAICIAWSWFLAKVEKVKPTARLAAMKSADAPESSASEPSIGTSNTILRANSTSVTWI